MRIVESALEKEGCKGKGMIHTHEELDIGQKISTDVKDLVRKYVARVAEVATIE